VSGPTEPLIAPPGGCSRRWAKPPATALQQWRRAEGLGLSMTAGNTTHGAAKYHSNRRERERESKMK